MQVGSCFSRVLCVTLCDPVDCSLPGSSVHEILWAEYWSGLPFPSPEDLPDQGIELASPAWQADSLLLSPWRSSFLCACILQNSISVYRHTKAKILFLLCSKVSHPGGKHQAPIHRPSRGLIGKANGAPGGVRGKQSAYQCRMWV